MYIFNWGIRLDVAPQRAAKSSDGPACSTWNIPLQEADAICAKVNKKTEASRARILAADDGPPRPGDKVRDEFLELVIYRNEIPAVANFLHEFYNSGSGVIGLAPNVFVAEGTASEVFRHDSGERLKKCLLASRAVYFVYRDGQWLNGHN